jgi:hypothetical protein
MRRPRPTGSCAKPGIIRPAAIGASLPRDRKVGHVHFGHIPARPIASPVVSSRSALVEHSDPLRVREADKKDHETRMTLRFGRAP